MVHRTLSPSSHPLAGAKRWRSEEGSLRSHNAERRLTHVRHDWLRLTSILTVIVLGGATDRPQVYAGPDGPITAQYFGMHIHHAALGTPWPAVQFASWRLWDSGVAWSQLEPQPGRWDFAFLDRYVQFAVDHNVEILLTLGLTPSWASARPQEVSAYGPGNAAEPRNLADWEDYVRTVATRYKGVIHSYEIWNEPNIKGSFSGSPEEMLQLSRAAYEVIKAIDAGITVVSPSPTTGAGVSWLSEFLAKEERKYSDAIGYHFYVTPDPPEAMIPLIQRTSRASFVREDARTSRCGTPNLAGRSPSISRRTQKPQAISCGTYVVNWLMGVERFYWYSWDNHNWSTLELTTRDGNQMTMVGAAYGVIREWMLGAVLRSCRLQMPGIWTCSLEQATAKSWIVWLETGTAQFDVPKSWGATQVSNWTGDSQALSSTLLVSSTPRRLSVRSSLERSR